MNATTRRVAQQRSAAPPTSNLFVAVALAALLRAACERVGLSPADIVDSAFVRVSARRYLEALLHQKNVGAQVFAHDDTLGHYLDALTSATFHGSSQRDEDRRRTEHGLTVVTDRDVASYASTSIRIGWFTVLRRPDGTGVLVVIVPDTALVERIQVPEVGGFVPWALLVRGLYLSSPNLKPLRFARDSRMARDLKPFSYLMDVVKKRPGGRIWWGSDELDPHTDGWRLVIGGQASAEGVSTFKLASFVGTCTRLKYSRWDKGEDRLPFFLRFVRVVDPRNGELKPVKGHVETDTDNLPALRAMVPVYACGADKTRVGCVGALAGARSAGGQLWLEHAAVILDARGRRKARRLLKRLVAECRATRTEADRIRQVLDDPPTGVRGRAARRNAVSALLRSVDTAFSAKYIRLLIDGEMTVRRYGTLPGRLSYDGWSVTYEEVDEEAGIPHDARSVTHGYIDFTVRWPVDHGLPAELLRQCLQLVERRRPRRQGGAAADGQRRPLAGLTWTQTDTDATGCDVITQYRITAPSDPNYYRIETLRPDELGPRAGWASATHAHTVRVTHAHRVFARQLLAVMESVDNDTAVPIALQAPVDDPLTRAEDRLAGLRHELNTVRGKIERVTDTLHDDALDDEDRQLYERQLNGYRARRAELRDRVTDAESEAAHLRGTEEAQPLVEAEADLQQLRAAGLLLARTECHAASILAEVLAWALDEGDLLRLRQGPLDNQLLLEMQVRVPTADGSLVLEAPVGQLTDIRRDGTGRRGTLDAIAADALLNQRLPLELAAELGHTDPAGALCGTSRWLEQHGITDDHLRRALVTAPPPIPAPQIVFANLTATSKTPGDASTDPDAARNAPYRQVVADTYLNGRTWAAATPWLRTSTAMVQTVLDRLASSPDGSTTLDVLATVPGYDDARFKRLLARLSFHSAPLRWTPGSNVIEVIRCPHPNQRGTGACGGRATNYVPCPELLVTGATVLCARCGRPPVAGAEDLYFPDPYLARYDRPNEPTSLKHATGLVETGTDATTGMLRTASYRIGDAARRLGVPTATLRDWSNRGLVTHTRVGVNRYYTVSDLDTAAVRDLVTTYHQRRDASLNVRQATKILEVPRASVITLIDQGHLQADADGRIRKSDLGRITDEHLRAATGGDDLLTVGEAQSLLGLTRKQFNTLHANGSLRPSHTTPGGHRLFQRREVETAAVQLAEDLGLASVEDLRDEPLLTTGQVARELGLSASTVRNVLAKSKVVAHARIGSTRLFARRQIATIPPRTLRALREGLLIGAAASSLRLSPAQLRRAADRGEVQCVVIGSKGTRHFLPEDIARYAAR